MKSSSIKRTLPLVTWVMVVVLSVLILPINVAVQMYMQHQSQEESAKEMFGQLEQLIESNKRTLERSEAEFAEKCIQAAEMAAYFVEHYPEVVTDIDHTKELARKLRVDELHYFTPEGEIYAGTHPEYYGYSFYSGEQMGFFLPMLENHSLALCQEITPNTAEGKEMQYAAVWLEDESGIVQIGMEPRHLLDLVEKKSLKNVFQMFPFEMHGQLHMVDRKTETIVASTVPSIVGMDLSGQVKNKAKFDEGIVATHYEHNGVRYCVYIKPYGDYFLVRAYLSSYLIKEIFQSMFLFACYALLIAAGTIGIIRWYVNKKLIRNLQTITDELRRNEDGKLENITLQTGITEYDELLSYINHMLDNIRLNWDKMSYIMDKDNISIGILEDNRIYKRTFVNQYMLDILEIADADGYPQEEKIRCVLEELRRAEKNPISADKQVYLYEKNGEMKYLRIEEDKNEQGMICYVTDISKLWTEMDQLRTKSELDVLVNLYNRRGFSEALQRLFAEPQKLGHALMIMIDVDNLKPLNDECGHLVGDEYLQRIAQILQETLGKKAVCARLGGDEFAGFVYDSTPEQLEQVLSALRKKRGESFASKQNDGVSHTIEFSMGAAYCPQEGTNFHQLMRLADEKMYQEKKIRKAGKSGRM